MALLSQTKEGHYYFAAHDVLRAVEDLEERASSRVSDDQPSENAQQPVSGSSRKRRGRRVRAKSGARARRPPEPKEGVKKSRSRSDDSSPTNLVRALVTTGYFDSPRTITDVQNRLREKHARKVPNTSLSPILGRLLKTGVLDRETNKDKVFEYTKVHE